MNASADAAAAMFDAWTDQLVEDMFRDRTQVTEIQINYMESEFVDQEGNLIGYWCKGVWDENLPYQGHG